MFNLLAFVPVMYARLYLGVDADAFGMKLVFSGLLHAGALCLLIWIVLFTASHEAEELQLRDVLAAVAAMAADAERGTAMGSGEGAAHVIPPVDSEF
eukprot:scaffold39290_cov298-Amphora_coffeaeformis.AAC.2